MRTPPSNIFFTLLTTAGKSGNKGLEAITCERGGGMGGIISRLGCMALVAVLGMEENLATLAAHDEVGIKLQNIKLLEGTK